MSVSARPTSRLLKLDCPICGVALQIHVRGLEQTIDPEAWLDSLPVEAWDYLHEEHTAMDSTVVAGPIARARQ